MSIPSQNHNFTNPAFQGIFEGITAFMPHITFYGVIGTYLVTALLNVFFVPIPMYVSIPAATAIVFIRFSIVFMDFLNPTGRRSWQPGVIAMALTIVAAVEFGFSIQEHGWGGPKFWATFLFGLSIIAGGYLIEINLVSKGAEAFKLGKFNNTTPGMITAQTAMAEQFQELRETLAGLKAENEFLKNQQQQATAQTPPTPLPGNGQTPVKMKASTSNLGHLPSYSSNGNGNGHKP